MDAACKPGRIFRVNARRVVLGVAPVIAPSLGAVVLLKASWHWIFAVLVVLAGALLLLAALALPETLPVSHRRPLHVRSIVTTYGALLRDFRFMTLVLVAALSMAGLFGYIAAAPFVLQGDYGLNQQSFALVFAAGAIILIGATQSNVVLLRRFSPQAIMRVALVVSVVAAIAFVALAVTGVAGLAGFLAPVLVILGGMGLVLPNAPAVALSRHHEASGTAAALLGAAQFGVGAVTAPVVGMLGNNEFALASVMLVGSAVALAAMVFVGGPSHAEGDAVEVLGDPLPEPA